MKKLMIVGAAMLAAVMLGACGENSVLPDDDGKEPGKDTPSATVKLVKEVRMEYVGDLDGDGLDPDETDVVVSKFLYDNDNRLTRIEFYYSDGALRELVKITYGGNTVTATDEFFDGEYSWQESTVCHLDSRGYAVKIESYDDINGSQGLTLTEEHTYDSNGYLVRCKQTSRWYEDEDYQLKWSNGNMISDGYLNYTYTSHVCPALSLDFSYMLGDRSCNAFVAGALGLCGKPSKNLRASQYLDNGEYHFKNEYDWQEFDRDGAPTRVTIKSADSKEKYSMRGTISYYN